MQRLFFLFLIAFGLSSRAAEIKISFGSYAAGQVPTNFTAAVAGGGAPGVWKIVADEAPATFAPLMPQITPTATTARRPVLAQLSDDPTDNRFPLFVYEGQPFKNFRLAAQFKIVGGIAEQMAGVVFRYQNPSNFYVLRASALGHNVRFYKVVNGQFADPSAPLDLKISTNVWHTLTVQCEGNRINCSLDNTVMPSIQTPNTFAIGKIGFWTKSDAVTFFSDATIDYTPIISPAQTLVDDTVKKYPRILGLRIYTSDGEGGVRVLASKVEKEIGMAGTDAERKTLESGTLAIGHGNGTVAVDYPLNDRNGEPIATVRVQLKSYMLGETTDMVLDRVRIIVSEMQKRMLTKEDLM